MPRPLAFAFLLLLAPAVSSREPPPTVLDGEKLFGQAAIDRVNTLAAEIQDAFGVQFVLETRKTAPGVDQAQLRKMRARDVAAALRDAAQRRADELGIKGLYVMYATEQRHVVVVGWPAYLEVEPAASSYKRNQLRKYLTANLTKNPDDALVRAVEQYKKHLGERTFESPMGTLRALLVVAGLLGTWALLGLVRRRVVWKGEAPPIYRPAMLGSLFGVPAGFWVHDQLFQAERQVQVPALAEVLAASQGIKPAPQEGIQTPVAVPPPSEEQP